MGEGLETHCPVKGHPVSPLDREVQVGPPALRFFYLAQPLQSEVARADVWPTFCTPLSELLAA